MPRDVECRGTSSPCRTGPGRCTTRTCTFAYPGRVRSLIHLDPVFNDGRPLPPEERSTLAWSVHMVLRRGSDRMAEGQVDDFYRPERFPEWPARYRVQQQFRGTREALRLTRVAIAAAPKQDEQLRGVGAHPRPVLPVWGRQDPVASFAEHDSVLAKLPQALFVPIDSAGHLPYLGQPGATVGATVGFLRRVR